MNNKLLTALTSSLQLLPLFVSSIQTLMGKGNGTSKKDAVFTLVNGSIVGTALGLSAAGKDTVAQAVVSMQSTISVAIDQAVEAFKTHQHPAFVDAPTGK